MVDSPEYVCQFVLVVKLAAVFHARSGATAGKPRLRNRWLWSRSNAYRNSTEMSENARTARVYAAAVCSTSGSTPISL
jgi:hypothetical protein